jgi:hypothetical protein
MAKIGTVNLQFEGEFRKSYELHYNQKQKFHIKGLTAEFLGLTNFEAQGYETERELVDKALRACRLYKELKLRSTKVIVYRCEASAELRMNRTDQSSWSGLLPGVSNKIKDVPFNSPLATFGIDFLVCIKIDDGTVPKYYKIDWSTGAASKYEYHPPTGSQDMPYTDERYKFFVNMVEGMKNIVLEASKFFGTAPNDLAIMLDMHQSFKMLTSKLLNIMDLKIERHKLASNF